MRESEFRAAFKDGLEATTRLLAVPQGNALARDFVGNALSATIDALELRRPDFLDNMFGEAEAEPVVPLSSEVRAALPRLLDAVWLAFTRTDAASEPGAQWVWVTRTCALALLGLPDLALEHHREHLVWFERHGERDRLEALMALHFWSSWRDAIAKLGPDTEASSVARILEDADRWLADVGRQPPPAPRVPGAKPTLATCVRGLAQLFNDGGHPERWRQHAERLWPEVMTEARAREISSALSAYWSRHPSHDSVRRFEDVPLALIATLGFLDNRHNDAPSARELLDTFGTARTDVLVGGYFVSPPRLDARVSVDSLVAPQAEVLMRWQTLADEVVQEPGDRLYLWFD